MDISYMHGVVRDAWYAEVSSSCRGKRLHYDMIYRLISVIRYVGGVS